MLNKPVKEIIEILQSNPAPGEKIKTLWEELKEQSMQAGTWDPKLLDAIEKKISENLSTIDEDNLRMMWETTENATASFDDRNEISLGKVKTDLVNELLSLVMDKLDTSGDYGDDLNQTKFMDDDGFKDDYGFDDPTGQGNDLF